MFSFRACIHHNFFLPFSRSRLFRALSCFPLCHRSPVTDFFPLLLPSANRLRNLPTCAEPPNKGYAYDHNHDLGRIPLAHRRHRKGLSRRQDIETSVLIDATYISTELAGAFRP